MDLQAQVRARLLGPTGRGRKLRAQAGLSLSELAAFVGVDTATLSRWERGQARPRGPSGERWAATCALIEEELVRHDQEVTVP